MIVAALSLYSANVGQSIERVNDPLPQFTSRVATAPLDTIWVKHQGKWVSFDGSTIPRSTDGYPDAKARNSNYRIRVFGYKYKGGRYAVILNYSIQDYLSKRLKGWVLIPEELSVSVFLVKGLERTETFTWNVPEPWRFDLLKFESHDYEGVKPWISRDDGNTWVGLDNFALDWAEGILRKGLYSKDESKALEWPIFPATPTTGKEIRFLVPTSADGWKKSDFDELYYQTTEPKWKEFQDSVNVMLFGPRLSRDEK